MHLQLFAVRVVTNHNTLNFTPTVTPFVFSTCRLCLIHLYFSYSTNISPKAKQSSLTSCTHNGKQCIFSFFRREILFVIPYLVIRQQWFVWKIDFRYKWKRHDTRLNVKRMERKPLLRYKIARIVVLSWNENYKPSFYNTSLIGRF